jgi:hypothetical protein
MSDLLGMHRAVMRSTRSIAEKMVLLAIIDQLERGLAGAVAVGADVVKALQLGADGGAGCAGGIGAGRRGRRAARAGQTEPV